MAEYCTRMRCGASLRSGTRKARRFPRSGRSRARRRSWPAMAGLSSSTRERRAWRSRGSCCQTRRSRSSPIPCRCFLKRGGPAQMWWPWAGNCERSAARSPAQGRWNGRRTCMRTWRSSAHRERTADGVSTTETSEAMVKQIFVARRRKCILVADARKWNHPATVRFAQWGEIDTWVTSTLLSPADANVVQQLGTTVLRVAPEE